MADCIFCREDAGEVLLRNDLLRVVLVDDADLPGFVRVIVNRHTKEVTDLEPEARVQMMRVVFGVEAALREVMKPLKMNVASLGNAVPHVHWHVIPRFADDAFFPQAVWAARQRETPAEVLATRRALVTQLRQKLKDVDVG